MSASKIILERMKTHPEEFVSLTEDIKLYGKWGTLLQSLKDWATPEEAQDITESMAKAKRLLADQVALQILAGEYISDEPIQKAYQHPYNNQNITFNTTNRAVFSQETIADIKKALQSK